MARETKAQREVRQAAERELRINDERVNYLPNFMALLERAYKLRFEIEPSDGKFVIVDKDDSEARIVYLSAAYSESNQNTLDDLSYYLDSKQLRIDEENKRHFAYQTAMNKLTKEEKSLLGLQSL